MMENYLLSGSVCYFDCSPWDTGRVSKKKKEISAKTEESSKPRVPFAPKRAVAKLKRKFAGPDCNGLNKLSTYFVIDGGIFKEFPWK